MTIRRLKIYNQINLFQTNRLETSIRHLQAFNDLSLQSHPNGYIVCDSGGKDSTVIKALAQMANVPFEICHNVTTADHPLTMQYIMHEQQKWQSAGISYTLRHPVYKGKQTSIWELIELKGPPTRLRRWCCDLLKRQGNIGRIVVTGIRSSESNARKKRKYYDIAINTKKRFSSSSEQEIKEKLNELSEFRQILINPILDWDDDSVWQFISDFKLTVNPLYSMGYERVGCIGCPFGRAKMELEKNPEFKQMYIDAFQNYLDRRKSKPQTRVIEWQSGEDVYNWWVSNKPGLDKNQISLFK